MGGGFALGRLFGFPIFVSYSALVILAFLVLQGGGDTPEALLTSLAFGVVVFGSILVHELGHAITATHIFKLGPAQIVLHGFGGLTTFPRPQKSWQSFVTSLAGPSAGLLLGGVLLAISLVVGSSLPPVATSLVRNAIFINIFWSLFNLLPMLPLDGGSMMFHALTMITAPSKALSIARGVSIVVAIGAALGGYFLLDSVFIAIVAAFSILQNLPRKSS